MGEANARGSQDERIQEARERKFDKAEVLIALNAEAGKLDISIMPRDEEPNQDSPALIFAAYLNANFDQLAGEAWQLYLSHNAAERGAAPMEGSVPSVIAETPVRSILTAEGDVARVDEVKLLGPDGSRLQ